MVASDLDRTSLRQRVLGILADLVAYPTVSSAPNLDLVRHVEQFLGRCGARVSVEHEEAGTRANLFATIGPDGEGGIMLAGHSDVVPAGEGDWTGDPFTLRVRESRAIGRGAADMKGFLACVLAMAPEFAAARHARPVHIAITYDEEVGCRGAKALVETLRRDGVRPAACIVGEPTGMHIVDAHKGCFEYTTGFTGLAGHGSEPDRGVNAVHHAAEFVAFLAGLGEELKTRAPAASPFDPPSTTIQVGRIAGGEARNIIAGHALVEWEFRPVNRADADFVLGAVNRHIDEIVLPAMRARFPGARVTTETEGEVLGLEPAGDSPAVRLVRRINGGKWRGAVSFGTEAGLYQAAGIATVVCGPGSITQAHTADEFIELSEIDRCLEMLGRLAGELAAGR